MKRTRIGLIGDFNPDVLAHQAINRSVTLSATNRGEAVESAWIGTESIVPGEDELFREVDGFWCVPASPYRNTAGALWAIEFARTRRVPFLGTCGGFQHALLEYVRNVHGLAAANHEELDSKTEFPLLSRLSCSLVEKSESVRATGLGRFGKMYEADSGSETYHCSYGLNPEYEHLFQSGPLEITARSGEGEVRAVELKGHPFFVAALFQPERRALGGVGKIHPLVGAFFDAAGKYAGQRDSEAGRDGKETPQSELP